ncbi:MAG TPA: LarC family nickel insertion protein [Steroidobacteraceae bacterium]|nr:LarC family nickel insertion protein [Steroidobacteraceae bacterium]
MHLQFDILGGVAGDMFIAALADAWPEHGDGMLAAVRAAGLPADWELGIAAHRDHVLGGKRFQVIEPRSHAHGHSEHEGHTSHRAIVTMLRTSSLPPAVVERAIAIFGLLADAESQVHGVAVDDVTYHEVGAWDSVADVVGAAWLLETLQPRSWSASPVPLGGGRVATAHGPMPVPAPATAILLRGFRLVDDGISGERVTPTGAALLAHLRDTLGPPAPMAQPGRLARSGTGFGTRELPGLSNVLRVLAFETAALGADSERIGVIEFEVDDQTAEDLAVGLEALRVLPGVLDVVQAPAFGKKGRLVTQVRVLCRRERLSEAIDACFLETTTLGLRWSLVARRSLPRTGVGAAAGFDVAVKRATRPDGRTTVKAEIASLAGPGGHAGRQQRRAQAETAAAPRAPDES